MSTSPYCTSPVTIFGGADSYYLDFLGKPSLGSLDNTDDTYNDTYHCIIIKMSETIKFSPKTTAGYCTQGTEYTQKLCGSSLSTTDPETGVSSACSGSDASDDTIFMYLSTASTGSDITVSTNPFSPPTSAILTRGLTLSTPWNVVGDYTADFVVNAFNRIESSNFTCVINTPTFSLNRVTSLKH